MKASIDKDRALAIFDLYKPPRGIEWTTERRLLVPLGFMSEWTFFQLWNYQYLPEHGESAAPALANGKPITITRETIHGRRYQVFTGSGAAEMARALRDDLRWTFSGCDYIP
jgi:hypothetical protein